MQINSANYYTLSASKITPSGRGSIVEIDFVLKELHEKRIFEPNAILMDEKKLEKISKLCYKNYRDENYPTDNSYVKKMIISGECVRYENCYFNPFAYKNPMIPLLGAPWYFENKNIIFIRF